MRMSIALLATAIAALASQARAAATLQSKRGFGAAVTVDCSIHQRFGRSDTPVSWFYNWGTWVPAEYTTCGMDPSQMLTWVPCIKKGSWIPTGAAFTTWFYGIPAAVRSRVPGILGIIEPNNAVNYITPPDAVALYRQWHPEARKAGIPLGAPTPTSKPDGVAWMAQFLALCDADPLCDYDFLVGHSFSCSLLSYQEELKPWLDWSKARGKGMWVNAYACRATANWNSWMLPSAALSPEEQWTRAMQKQLDFMTGATGWMDSEPTIKAYAFYEAHGKANDTDFGGTNNLWKMQAGSPLTNLGRKFME